VLPVAATIRLVSWLALSVLTAQYCHVLTPHLTVLHDRYPLCSASQATEGHLGLLKAKLAKLKRSVATTRCTRITKVIAITRRILR
jgi:hypothetical protein